MTYVRALQRAILALSFASSPDDAKAKLVLEEELRKIKLLYTKK